MSAAGRPKKSSPSFRSLLDSSRKSRSAVNSPVIPVSKPLPPAARTTSITPSMLSSAFGPMPIVSTAECRSSETRSGEERWSSMWCVTPSASMSLRRSRTFVSKAGSSTTSSGEWTITSSFTNSSSGGMRSKSSS